MLLLIIWEIIILLLLIILPLILLVHLWVVKALVRVVRVLVLVVLAVVLSRRVEVELKNVCFSILLFFFFTSNTAFAALGQVCGYATIIDVVYGGGACSSVADPYPVSMLSSGCTVNASTTSHCLSQYYICCPDVSKAIEQSTYMVKSQAAVQIGSEIAVRDALLEQAQLTIQHPVCPTGFAPSMGLQRYYADVQPNATDYRKVDVTVSLAESYACSAFTNNSTVVLIPSSAGGGSTVQSFEQALTLTNSKLDAIKASIDFAKGENLPVLNDIKTILLSGLSVSGAGSSTDMTATNNLLASIDAKLKESCTTTYTIVRTSYITGGPCSPNETSCYDGLTPVTTCDGVKVKDELTLNALNEIKNALNNLRFNNYSGTSAKVDMMQTNSILESIKNFFVSNTPVPSVNSTAYDTTLSTPQSLDWKARISSWMLTNPLVSVISNTRIELIGAQCSFTGLVFGHPLTIEFCSLASWLNLFGVLFVGICVLRSFFIAFGID